MGGPGSGSMKKGMPARKGSGSVAKAMKEDGLAPGFASKLMHGNKRVFDLSLQPYDYRDPDQLAERLSQWFEICEQEDLKPLYTGLSLVTGLSKESLYSIAKNGNRNPNGRGLCVDMPDASIFLIKKCYEFIEDSHMQASLNYKSGMPAATGIFTAKNWYGYKDVQDVQVSAHTTLADDGQDPETVAAKYIDALPNSSTSERLSDGNDSE